MTRYFSHLALGSDVTNLDDILNYFLPFILFSIVELAENTHEETCHREWCHMSDEITENHEKETLHNAQLCLGDNYEGVSTRCRIEKKRRKKIEREHKPAMEMSFSIDNGNVSMLHFPLSAVRMCGWFSATRSKGPKISDASHSEQPTRERGFCTFIGRAVPGLSTTREHAWANSEHGSMAAWQHDIMAAWHHGITSSPVC